MKVIALEVETVTFMHVEGFIIQFIGNFTFQNKDDFFAFMVDRLGNKTGLDVNDKG